MKITDKFVLFFSYKDMFSNHYYAPIQYFEEKINKIIRLPTLEHYMMFHKAILFNDSVIADAILEVKNPNDAKKLGRRIEGYDDALWSSKRSNVVENGIFLKLQQHQHITKKAIEYYQKGLIFVEASPYDKIWGCGFGEEDIRATDENLWVGQNLLGKCWMQALFKLSVKHEGIF